MCYWAASTCEGITEDGIPCAHQNTLEYASYTNDFPTPKVRLREDAACRV